MKDDRSMFQKEASPDDADRTFPNKHHPNIIQGLNRKCISRHRSSWSRDWYFSADIAQLFYKRWPMIFFTVEDAFLLGVAVKIYNVGRLGFFVRAQPKLCFGRHRHVFIYSARKTFSHLGKKLYSPVLIEKNPSRHRQRKLTDRGLKGKSPGGADRTFPHRHHANIIQGLIEWIKQQPT